jgi:protocatechuate 3,4-dioxygenase beta subunit
MNRAPLTATPPLIDPAPFPADQAQISAEIAAAHRTTATAGPETQPRLNFAPYRSTVLRHPTRNPQLADPESIELVAPVFGPRDVDPLEADLTIARTGEPIGQRIVLTGRVVDGAGRPVTGQLVEIWQANAAGRYIHQHEQHPAPLDPNFVGAGRCLTDADGIYRFTTIRPGAYPWANHLNAWRPAHIHFSLFGTDFTQRLVTQMYFPDDPLFPLDPIYQSIVDPAARERLVAHFDHELNQPNVSLGYRWDVVLGGDRPTWLEPQDQR